MNLAIAPDTLVAFVLVTTRMLAAFVVAPPFAGALVPFRIRVALAAGVGLVVAPGQSPGLPLEVAPLVAALVYQVVVGGLFGYLVQLLLSAPLIAGTLIDNMSGFSVAGLFDPFSLTSATPAARLNQLIATIILILLEGHLLIVRGLLRSYEAAPLSGLRVDSLRAVLEQGMGALLLAEVVLALATRAAPQLNVMVVGFALKSLVFTLGFSLGLPLIINATAALLDRSLVWAVRASGG